MWKEQAKVPRLPVPTLKETLDRYIDTVTPFTPVEQLNATKKIVQDFYEGEESKKLQEDLLNLDKESPTSYLEGFWDTMYLELRDPVIINVNPYVILKDDPQRKSQESRAANIITGALKFLQKIRSNTAEPDLDKDGPLDMSQYLRIFGTSRIPQWRRDYLITDSKSRHITVMHKNHFFTLEVIKSDGSLLSEEEMQSYFKHIVKQVKSPAENAIGIFTAEERNRWAALRSELIADPTNKNSLDKIDSSLLVLILDDLAPTNALESSEAMLHNRNGTNRWFDKLNIVVFANSQTGVVFEHSPIDGHTVLRTVTEAVSHSKAPVVSSASLHSTSALSPLKWNLTDSIKNSIEISKKNAHSLISSLQTSPLIYTTVSFYL